MLKFCVVLCVFELDEKGKLLVFNVLLGWDLKVSVMLEVWFGCYYILGENCV